ncbi:MAG TPA: hypothetical protein VGN72_08955 [Tepidisphaeraceae bacterium]|nr:hypothetical protein [Tepidisphaeraceae bacterium]
MTSASITLAQPAPAPGGAAAAAAVSIPRAARGAESAAGVSQHNAAINAFIAANVKALMGDDAKARSDARDAIIAEAPTNGATPIYLRTYAGALEAALLPTLANASPVAKLNLAITVARVAERANNTQLAGITRQLLKDPSDAIVLWGMKAAQSIVPVLAATPLDTNLPLIGEVVASAKAHNTSYIIDEAYMAVNLSKSGNTTKAMVTAVLPHMQDLLAHRVGLYANGVPPLPAAENRATAFLVHSSVWSQMDEAQKLTALQTMVDLLNAASRQYAAQQQARGELSPLLKLTGSAFQVVASNVGNEPMRRAAQAVSSINPSNAPTQVNAAVSELLTATTAVPAFNKLKISGSANAATQPAATALSGNE